MFRSLLLLLVLFEASVGTSDWNKLVDKTHEWSVEYSHQLMDRFVSIEESKNISTECRDSIRQTLNALENLELWAIQMVNSWGSFPSTGAIVGTSTDFGSFDQCLGVKSNPIIDRSQYCLIDLVPPIPKPMPLHHNLLHSIDVLPEGFDNKFNKSYENVFKKYSEFASFFYWISLRTGICTPSKCKQNDISLLAKGFASNYGLELKRVRCEIKPTEVPITTIQLIAILFLMCVLVLSLMATLFDKFNSKNTFSTKTSLIIDLLSIKHNFNSLFANRTSEVLPCLHGIRVITMIWIVLGHSTEFMDYQLFSRAFKAREELVKMGNYMLLNGHYSVETFFFISGLLTTYITFQYTRGKLFRFKVSGFLMARILRVSPQILILMLLSYLMTAGGWVSGPVWHDIIDPQMKNCATNWWWNLFFIQNWFPRSKGCAIITWYIACDMQFHWASLPLIIALLYSYKVGVLLLYSTILICYGSTMMICYYFYLPPGLINTTRDTHFFDVYLDVFYHKPFGHSTSFFLGLVFGLIVYKKKFVKLNTLSQVFAHGLICAGYLLCLLDTYYWSTGKPFNRLMSAFILSTTHLIWPLCTAGLIWMCISGNAPIINKLLSAHIFTPFSRLTYSVYLTHEYLIWIYVGTRRERIDTNFGDIYLIIIHNIVLAYFVGFLFSLFFEMPFLRLFSHLRKNIQKSEVNTGNTSDVRSKLNHKSNDIEL